MLLNWTKGLIVLAGIVSAGALELKLRGTPEAEQFSCSIAGAGGEDACDASNADDGSSCVWCELQSYGLCVSDAQAETMKKAIPGLKCDDSNDDDSISTDDDVPGEDDDSVPDDYWECLKNYDDAASCGDAGCAWCDTNAGYGICMDEQAAEAASKSDWFDCKMSALVLKDPYDTSCLAASMQEDEASCEATLDQDGQACEWCSVASVNLCLTLDQAQIAETLGGDCTDADALAEEANINDPYDTSCLAASMESDEGACEATLDQDGHACEWCSLSSVDLCLTSDQAAIAEQLGGECNGTGNTPGATTSQV